MTITMRSGVGMRNGSEKSKLYRDKAERLGYHLLDDYIDSTTKVRAECPNGHIRECLYKSLEEYSCRECVNEEKLISLISRVKDLGYTILEYPDDARSVITAECSKGHLRKAQIYNFINHNCSECVGSKTIKKSIDECRSEFEKQGFTLLDEEYVNCKTMMKYICVCGEIRETTLDIVMHNRIKSCNLCKGENITGEHHYNWKGGITPKNVRIRNSPEAKKWRMDVFFRDNFTCQKCNKKGNKLNAHHLYNFSSHKELRNEVSNGITLCESCHRTGEDSFHKRYGYRNNTPEQIKEFLDEM